MATIKLPLKLRAAPREIILGESTLQLLETVSEDREKFLAQLQAVILKNTTTHVHDLQWLEHIINWVPPDEGMTMVEGSKWSPLAKIVARLPKDKEYHLTLTPFFVELIWLRLTNPKFKTTALPIQYREFIMAFQALTGRHFAEEAPDGDLAELSIEEITNGE